MKFKKECLILAFIGAFIPAMAVAHKGATGQVKVRMDSMKSIAESTKIIGLMLAGKSEINYSVIKHNSDAIAIKASEIPAHFKMNMISDVSEASPRIWIELDKFNAMASDLGASAKSLAQQAVARSELGQLRLTFKAMGKTCSSCHADYRIKK